MKIGLFTRQLMVRTYQEKLRDASCLLFTNFKGVTADGMRQIRAKLKETSSEMIVVKNSILKRALTESGMDFLIDLVEAETAVVYGIDDPLSVAKTLQELAKDFEGLKVRAGWIEGKILDEKGIKELASIPAQEVLYAKLVGLVKAPLSNLVFVLKGNLQVLVSILSQIKDKKQG